MLLQILLLYVYVYFDIKGDEFFRIIIIAIVIPGVIAARPQGQDHAILDILVKF